MKLIDHYDGSLTPFQGDHTLSLRSLPANAQIQQATITLTPIDITQGADPFAEVIRFKDTSGDWGATKTRVTEKWVEVDFHARRTLANVKGTNLDNTTLQIDLGGVYVEINASGGIKVPKDKLFTIDSSGSLPGLTVTKFKLVTAAPAAVAKKASAKAAEAAPAEPSNPDIDEVTIRSVPANVSLRLGEMSPFWMHVGEMSTPQTTSNFTAVLQAYLATAKAENGFFLLPLIVHSDTIARLSITVEIEYLLQTSILPPALNEVTLPFDYGGLPKAQQQLLQVQVPANMRVAPGGVKARVTGAFNESRVAYGPLGAVTPAGAVSISPSTSQALPFTFHEAMSATAVDLLLAITRSATLQIDLRGDLDGKPDNKSLLPEPATLELAAPVGVDRKTAGPPQWVSMPLPMEFKFEQDKRYWLLIQSIDGDASWSVSPAETGTLGIQYSADGGFSWREAVAIGVKGPVNALFRLRRQPEHYQVPVALQVGSGDHAVRVDLDRFQPLGRVDFALDFDEVTQAFNQYLNKTTPSTCPTVEHLANGDFEEWLVEGDELGNKFDEAELGGKATALAMSPDGRVAYVGITDTSSKAFIRLVDTACNKVLPDRISISSGSPINIAVHPDGARAYVFLNDDGVQLIDIAARREVGTKINLYSTSPGCVVLSNDGHRLFVAKHPGNWLLMAYYTKKLERVSQGQLDLDKAMIAYYDFGNTKEPMALAITSDGSHLWLTVVDKGTGENNASWIYILDAVNLQELDKIQVGKNPTAIALTPDNQWAVVANNDDKNITIIDVTRRQIAGTPISIPVNQNLITALAISHDGEKVYVVTSGSPSKIGVVDLRRQKLISEIGVSINDRGVSLSPAILTPQGDRIYVLNNASAYEACYSISVGQRFPTEWTRTSNNVFPCCLDDPCHLVALLGLNHITDTTEPTTLSQVVPVAESCAYEFSFWAIADEPDAVAEVIWRSDDCGLLRTDQIPILASIKKTELYSGSRVQYQTPPSSLIMHQQRLLAPNGANQAEVRFFVPAGVQAWIDRVSLKGTTEALTNADFSQKQTGQLQGWTQANGTKPVIASVTPEGTIELRNTSGDLSELVQTLTVNTGQNFTLRFQGRLNKASVQGSPRIELRWFKKDDSLIEPRVVLEILPMNAAALMANGTVPETAAEAEIHLLIPAGAALSVQHLSLQFSAPVQVPVNFISHAPGELTITDWKIAFEEAPVSVPPIPAKGLCPPAPIEGQPGKSSGDCCYCCCCKGEQMITGATAVVTGANRPAIVGRCSKCGSDLVRYGVAQPSGTRSIQTLSSTRRIIRYPRSRSS